MVALAELKREQQKRMEQAIRYGEIEWNNFLFTFKEPHIRVLEGIYLPQPKSVIYKHVYQAFKQINYSERSARRIINELAKLGLLINFTSTFGVIKPIPEITSNVQSLIQLYRSKEHRMNEVQKEHYDEIARLILEDKGWPQTEEDPNNS